MKNRIEYLDGHRGLAILLVILFHAYARHPDIVPYGNQYGNFPLFKFGWLGVQLFFLISGFVILMTLDKCATMREFIYRRWLRLFPAMLICSTIIFLTSTYFFERPAGIPELRSLLPGLTFIDSYWWTRLIHLPIKPLEASFWSLFVEFKFYVFAAIFYYWRGRKFLIGALIVAFVISIISEYASKYIGDTTTTWLLNGVASNLSFQHFGWFASGASFYIYSQLKSRQWLILAIIIAIVSSAIVASLQWTPFLLASCISLFFTVSSINSTSTIIQICLNNRIVQFFGFISYPLYLVHENMMVSIIIKLGHQTTNFPSGLLPALAIGPLSVLAFLLAKYAEPQIRHLISRILFIIIGEKPNWARK
jgi:peptidoglycan/LPS O-acetylase OafA/YrhL